MFAGPNGSGKSTLKARLREDYPELRTGVDISPDDVERWVREHGELDLDTFGVVDSAGMLLEFMLQSELLRVADFLDSVRQARVEGSRLVFPAQSFNSYHATVVCHFIRNELLHRRQDITIETVMSSTDKIDLLREAKALGYRNYLYFVATSSPEINVSRVANRVLDGGHAVPDAKIRSRYYRSISLLNPAVELTDRAYVFDNSEGVDGNLLVVEITNGEDLKFHMEYIPDWVARCLFTGG